MEYHKTKDIIHVQRVLGHKNIQNTILYINLEKAIFNSSNDEFHVHGTRDSDEAAKLLEAGSVYECTTPMESCSSKRENEKVCLVIPE